MSGAEKRLLDRFRALPHRQQVRVLHLVEAVREGADPDDVEFDLWARLLARRRGFEHLSDGDIEATVHRHCRR